MQTSKLRTDRGNLHTSQHESATNGVSQNGHAHQSVTIGDSDPPDVLALIDRAYADLLAASQHLDAGGELHHQMLRGIRAVQIVHDGLRSQKRHQRNGQRRAPKS